MNWHYVDIKEVYQIHQLIVKRAKTKARVRDFTLLHSALERPKATWEGKDLYRSIFDKAAALLQSLCLNHPFTDANKRTAWTVTHKFLWSNGHHLKANRNEAADFMVWVDNGKPELKQISRWLRLHTKISKS